MKSFDNGMLKSVMLDAYVHRRWLVAAFVAITLAAVAIAILSDKKFESSTTVFVEDRNTLDKLMEGTAVQSAVKDRVQIAREIIYGRKFVDQVLENQGFDKNTMLPIEWDRHVEAIRKKIDVANKGGRNTNLIKINFESSDPDQAYETTQFIAELFISEANATQMKESESAFRFIDNQVKDYERKLRASEEQLKNFRAENESVRPGSEADARVRIRNLRIKKADLEQEIKEARIRETAITAQLSGEGRSAAAPAVDQNSTRKLQLQAQLELLRLSYHDTYPDIVQLKAQIEELDELVEKENRRREEARAAARAAGLPYSSSDPLALNPVALKLQQDLYDTRTKIVTLRSRIKEAEITLDQEVERGLLIPAAEAKLVELTRDYNVTRDIYEDLLERREKARVSMSLNREQRGLSLRVDEPAFYPYTPSGPRFVEIILFGLLLAIAIPFGTILGLQQMNPKVRLLPHITDEIDVPVLGVVPHLADPTELRIRKVDTLLLGSLIILTFIAIGVAGALRLQGKI